MILEAQLRMFVFRHQFIGHIKAAKAWLTNLLTREPGLDDLPVYDPYKVRTAFVDSFSDKFFYPIQFDIEDQGPKQIHEIKFGKKVKGHVLGKVVKPRKRK